MINMYVYLLIVTSIIRFWVGYAVGGFVVKKTLFAPKMNLGCEILRKSTRLLVMRFCVLIKV